MVKCVEHIQTELETHLFVNREVFLNTQVPVVETRRAQIGEIPWGVSEFELAGATNAAVLNH